MFPNRPLINQFVNNQQQRNNNGYQGNQPQQQNQYGGYQGNQPQQQNQYGGNQQQQNYQQNQNYQQQQYQQNMQQQQQRQQQQLMQQQQQFMQQQMQQQQNMMNQQMNMMNNMNNNMNQNNMMYGQLTSVNLQQNRPQGPNFQQQNQQKQQFQQRQQNMNMNTNNNNNNLNKKLDTNKYSNTQRDQPLGDATPSLKPLKNNQSYTDNDAEQDADTLYKAFKGMGSDKKTIMMVSGRRTTYQRVMIKRAYNKKYGKKEGFIKRLKNETSGKFQDMLVFLYKDAGFIDANVIHDAFEGMGFNTDQLLEVLVTRTNQEIHDMKTIYQKKFNEPLEKRLEKETKKTFGNNNFQKFCLKICEGKRPRSGNDNQNAIKEDAEMLNRQLNQNKKEVTKASFVKVFTERSWSHISQLAGQFQQISKKYTLVSAIQHAFGKSDTAKGLQYIVDFVTQPYDF